jgi:hypothetical protein
VTVPSPPEEMDEESLLFSRFIWGVITVDLAGENRKTSKGFDLGDEGEIIRLLIFSPFLTESTKSR